MTWVSDTCWLSCAPHGFYAGLLRCTKPPGWISVVPVCNHLDESMPITISLFICFTLESLTKKITFEIRLLKTTSPFVFDCLQVARIIVIMSFAVVNLPTSLVNLSIRATSDLGTAWFFLTFSRAYVKIAFVLISHFRHLKKILVITFKVWCPSVVFKTHNTYMRNFKIFIFFLSQTWWYEEERICTIFLHKHNNFLGSRSVSAEYGPTAWGFVSGLKENTTVCCDGE